MTGAPTVLTVSGPKNSGKTHLVEALIEQLTLANWSFAVIKHDAHAHMQIDHPGKDSWRFRVAGASRVAVVGPLGTVRLEYAAPFTSADGIDSMATLFPGTDLLIGEGFKDHNLPRIKLIGERDRPAERMVLSAEPVTDEALSNGLGWPLSVKMCMEFIEALSRKTRRPFVRTDLPKPLL